MKKSTRHVSNISSIFSDRRAVSTAIFSSALVFFVLSIPASVQAFKDRCVSGGDGAEPCRSTSNDGESELAARIRNLRENRDNGSQMQGSSPQGCREGWTRSSTGGCKPNASVDCRNGTYCPQDSLCTKDNACLYLTSARVCSDEKAYCPQGSLCTKDIKCLPLTSARVCSDGKSYCQQGSLCTNDNRCLRLTSARACSDGISYCNQGSSCTKDNKCLPLASEPEVKDAMYKQFFNQADADFDRGALDKAIEGYVKALEYRPNDPSALGNIKLVRITKAKNYLNEGNFERSIAESQKAILVEPNGESVYENTARAILKEAREQWDREQPTIPGEKQTKILIPPPPRDIQVDVRKIRSLWQATGKFYIKTPGGLTYTGYDAAKYIHTHGYRSVEFITGRNSRATIDVGTMSGDESAFIELQEQTTFTPRGRKSPQNILDYLKKVMNDDGRDRDCRKYDSRCKLQEPPQP